MPYVRDSASPPQRELSSSPEIAVDHAGPSTKHRNTVIDQQRRQVEKLLANPEREVQLPTGAKERTLRAPREMMKNVQGSSAGAGSGEFHVYKQSRRREYERLKIMNDKARAEEEQSAFQARQAERDALADAKTAKNRAKRQKRKHGAGGAKKPNGEGSTATGEGGLAKRKLGGGGAGIVFKKPGEEGSESEDETPVPGAGGREDSEEVGPSVPVLEHPIVEATPVAEEAKILIVDDD
ncbi:hypothetical protein CI109_104681 [Kwoniella shandongensis]|uniref:Uncharacterized protein n=1 Tax=Kwoniella shandongensis TaxID=1734106 RepID=A0A5M6BZL0_9TREE|nr:uncharacterized protein CI109_004845 [Kwoniella shandongensis]KAA5526845.1 hypothetical protein CI109_004845 [Kwoniella shandongensis]